MSLQSMCPTHLGPSSQGENAHRSHLQWVNAVSYEIVHLIFEFLRKDQFRLSEFYFIKKLKNWLLLVNCGLAPNYPSLNTEFSVFYINSTIIPHLTLTKLFNKNLNEQKE
jgi:hypothetical protein